MSDVQSDAVTDEIRALNNHCRCTFSGCSIMLTAAVAAMEPEAKAKLLEAVRTFDAFNDDNDPHGEADMAFLDIDGERYFFKWDYYDPSMKFGAEDPSDPAKCRRVLTIGMASDY